jgi:DNA-binding CsgD family transcriptional regulator
MEKKHAIRIRVNERLFWLGAACVIFTALLLLALLLLESRRFLFLKELCGSCCLGCCIMGVVLLERGRREARVRESVSAEVLLELDNLTRREKQVSLAYISGKSTKEIAADLGLSPSTVRNTLRSGYKRLGIAGSGELLALGAAHDLASRKAGMPEAE